MDEDAMRVRRARRVDPADDRPRAWAIRGAFLTPFVILAHEGTHAVVACAHGFGPVVIRHAGTEAARLTPFLHGLDIGVAPAAAAAAADVQAAGAIVPTWAGLAASLATAFLCWIVVLWRTAAATRAGWGLRAVAALGTASAVRLAPFWMLGALALGCSYRTGDEPRVAVVYGSAAGHQVAWTVAVALGGVAGWGLGADMLRRVVMPAAGERVRRRVWVAGWPLRWLALVGACIGAALLTMAFMPAIPVC